MPVTSNRRNSMAYRADNREKKALKNPKVVGMKITEVMRKYGISYSRAKKVIATVKSDLRKTESGRSLLVEADRKSRISSLRTTCKNAHRKYPELFPRVMLSAESMASVGTRYGLSRERVRQIADRFRELRRLSGKSAVEIIRSL